MKRIFQLLIILSALSLINCTLISEDEFPPQINSLNSHEFLKVKVWVFNAPIDGELIISSNSVKILDGSEITLTPNEINEFDSHMQDLFKGQPRENCLLNRPARYKITLYSNRLPKTYWDLRNNENTCFQPSILSAAVRRKSSDDKTAAYWR